ncbi:MAG: transcriptional regulator, TetR family [Phenylobacterium sp.]|nr:transcriptional regulator, TetR family [Phenylobacterium sp.]
MLRPAVKATHRFEKKREAILDAATELLNSRGVRGLTLSEVAAAVGLSTTSVTYYFKRKDELAAACMLRGIAALEAMAERAVAEPTPAARLKLLLELYMERVRQSLAGEAPPLPGLSDLRALNPPHLAFVFDAYMKLFRQVRQLFHHPDLEWLSAGRQTARTHLLLEQLFWAAAWLLKYDVEDYPRIRDRTLEILVEGMAPDGAAWAPAHIAPSQIEAPGRRDVGRETFLIAATQLINARGYRGASVDKISAALQVTKGSFYHHNEAKDDLVVACFERTFEIMRRVQRLAMDLPANEWTRLCSAAAALAEFQLSERGPLLRMSALTAVPEPIRMQMVLQSARVSDRFASMISDGIAEGSIRPVDPFIAAQMLNATLNAAAELAFWVPGVKSKAAPAIFARPMLMGLFNP